MDLNDESRFALGMATRLKPHMESLGALLPDGTDFGIMVLVPNGGRDRTVPHHIVAITTDRTTVALAVGQWCVDVIGSDDHG